MCSQCNDILEGHACHENTLETYWKIQNFGPDFLWNGFECQAEIFRLSLIWGVLSMVKVSSQNSLRKNFVVHRKLSWVELYSSREWHHHKCFHTLKIFNFFSLNLLMYYNISSCDLVQNSHFLIFAQMVKSFCWREEGILIKSNKKNNAQIQLILIFGEVWKLAYIKYVQIIN